MSSDHDLVALRDTLRDFSAARGWRVYHTPKNLAMALIVEAAELVEHFQWATPEESSALAPDKAAEVADEVADVLIYLVELADALGIDLIEAAHAKIAKNALLTPIIGGGPIGLEMAQAHARLGCRVTVLEARRIMPKDDAELVELLRQCLEAEGIRILEEVSITAASASAVRQLS